MGIATICMILICFWKMKIHGSGIQKEYLAKGNSGSIKGIFVIAVLITHTSQYIEVGSGVLEIPYHLFDDYIAQCIVAPFLFCSGYGMMLQFTKRGKDYILQIPKRRFLRTLLHFDIAIILFGIMNWVLGIHYPKMEYLTALVGWNSVGNSTWYIFASLAVYVLFYISGMLSCCLIGDAKAEKRGVSLLILMIFGSLLYILVMGNFKIAVYYNTIMSFSAGCLFTLIKDKYDRLCTHFLGWACAVLGLATLYIVGFFFLSYNFRAPVLSLLVFTLTMKFEVKNPVLSWLGEHIFSIYILQRIPMIVLSHFEVNAYPYAFITASWGLTFVLAWIFDTFTNSMDKKLKLI